MKHHSGFTLIELSIVLVIIGLIVGGVLVGRDLIAAAAVRSQVSQIEQFQTATNTFTGKYGYLPGDIPEPDASNFGFFPRLGGVGGGDGNGALFSKSLGSGYSFGEVTVFWRDLSAAGFIQTPFSLAGWTTTGALTATTTPAIKDFFPLAAIAGNYVSIFYGGYSIYYGSQGKIPEPALAANWFSVSNISSVSATGVLATANGLTVRQAYDIDKKMDDGLPTAGNVLALKFFNLRPVYADGTAGWYSGAITSPPFPSPPVGPTTGSSTSCFDTDAGMGEQYSINQSGGVNINCALSFKFK